MFVSLSIDASLFAIREISLDCELFLPVEGLLAITGDLLLLLTVERLSII